MDINRWWKNFPHERYWVETTDRPDIGLDLKAPQLDESRKENWRYALINEVGDGDVVYHYRKQDRAITAWSWAVGTTFEDQITWAAHGTSARNRGVTKYRRDGWRLRLEGPFPLSEPVTLADLVPRVAALRHLVEDMRRTHGTLYFPFELGDRPSRPLQGYIFKLPERVREIFPVLKEAVPRVNAVIGLPPVDGARHSVSTVGHAYVPADEDTAPSNIALPILDPATVIRGRRGHARTQNLLADAVDSASLQPRKPAAGDPPFDLAWNHDGTLYVAEVKSLTEDNEAHQLRLGLGQVLQYQYMLELRGWEVIAVLAVERQPTDAVWNALCQRHDVVLLWPEVMADRLPPRLQA